MLILGMETSTPVSSVALWRGDEPLASIRVGRARGHVEFLVPAIDALCVQAGVAITDLNGVATGLGPGLFTSMRVGIATAKGIAQALGAPMIGVCSLDLLALAVRSSPRSICACIDARKSEVFAAFYRSVPDGIERVSEYATFSPDALAAECRARGERVLFTGNGAALYHEVLSQIGEATFASGWDRYPSADALCELAVTKLIREEGIAPSAIEPIYVRKTDAEIRWEERGVTIERPSRVRIAKP